MPSLPPVPSLYTQRQRDRDIHTERKTHGHTAYTDRYAQTRWTETHTNCSCLRENTGVILLQPGKPGHSCLLNIWLLPAGGGGGGIKQQEKLRYKNLRPSPSYPLNNAVFGEQCEEWSLLRLSNNFPLVGWDTSCGIRLLGRGF